MKINLSKKSYVISAGADGLGFAIANKIISSGGKVYLSDINKSKIDKINSNKKYHNKIFAKHLDCTNPKDIKEYFKSLSNLKKIDGLINNIGIAGPTKYLQNISIDEWDNTIKTNLSSHFYFAKFAIPFLKKAKKENCMFIPDLNDLERKLDKIIEPNDLFITIGAGTIWRYSDSYAQHLNQQYNYS